MSPIIIIIIVAFCLVVLAVVGVVIWLMMKGKKQFTFILYSADGKSRKTIHGKVKTDPENKSNKLFFFDNNDSTLEIREPNAFVDGNPVREITVNENGEYSYLKTSMNSGTYRLMALTPEERQITIARMKENNRRYEEPLNKAQAYMLITGFVVVLLLIVGIVYCTIAFSKNLKEVVVIAKDNQKNLELQKQSLLVQQEIVEQLAGIAGALTGDLNLTRQIS